MSETPTLLPATSTISPAAFPLAGSAASRRGILLAGLGVGGVLATGGGTALAATMGPAGASNARLPKDPFTLGVASGDPTSDGMVLWTRLAPNPLADDGFGGMPNRATLVEWEISENSRFSRPTRRGTVETGPRDGHAVHVEVRGLRADREYFFRFRAGGFLSPAGRTRTTPSSNSLSPLTMCFASCSQFEHGWFTAYRRLAEDRPDLILHLGDYQYEYKAGDYVASTGNVRDAVGPETVSLANYRQRYAQYKTDPDLQLAHAAAPWLVVWDDHEVDNNWADEVYERPQTPQPDFLDRRAAAFRAYYENMPLRRSAIPRGIDMRLFRRVEWGKLATFHMLDTRQYRGDQPCDDRFNSDCTDRTAPTRSITGAEQEAWLLDGFRRSKARWDVLGQQVFFSQVDFTPGAARGYNVDAWDGYPINRDRVRDAWVKAKVRNTVVLTGDVHAAYAAEVKADFNDPTSRTVGTELVGTSITSGGDGSDTPTPSTQAYLAENPHIKYYANRRGYVRTRWTADSVTAEYRFVPSVSTKDAPAETRAKFVIADRNPGLRPA